jgi:hypothetical protein
MSRNARSMPCFLRSPKCEIFFSSKVDYTDRTRPQECPPAGIDKLAGVTPVMHVSTLRLPYKWMPAPNYPKIRCMTLYFLFAYALTIALQWSILVFGRMVRRNSTESSTSPVSGRNSSTFWFAELLVAVSLDQNMSW